MYLAVALFSRGMKRRHASQGLPFPIKFSCVTNLAYSFAVILGCAYPVDLQPKPRASLADRWEAHTMALAS